ncbi:transglutaminase-like domain-containing protein [Butyrivibrio sp. AE3004]|uniref:transglutaminase-like domain-containing protein n=1 Tax=Butyrivibrio sp. AE3004 TaxID=1506994 RepID=UPI00068AD8C9|nr:transglutaminase-like domain-containing protein [Butyrivibrio sp. AE3004]
MEYINNKKNQFHISEDNATGVLLEVLKRTGRNSDFLTEDTENKKDDKPEKTVPDYYTVNILLILAMLVIVISTPILLFMLPSGPVIDPDRELAAKAMANRENYDTTVLPKGLRDNTPMCLRPFAGGKDIHKNDLAIVDATNASDGYLVIRYIGDSGKVKLRITGPDEIVYTYNLATGGGKDEVFPLQAGDGTYLVCVYENLAATQYVTAFSEKIDVTLNDKFLPFLYPNQYVDFNEGNQAIAYSEYLAYTANDDLEVVSNIYNALISSLTYDYEEAETVQSGYIPDVDEVLTTGKGICLDYAVLMTAMLRSQKIPTRMEVGYAGTAYHAWISTYITDIGWVNGMIHFDGKEWSLMDPTFASTTDNEKLASFIGDGKNYQTKYIY